MGESCLGHFQSGRAQLIKIGKEILDLPGGQNQENLSANYCYKYINCVLLNTSIFIDLTFGPSLPVVPPALSR